MLGFVPVHGVAPLETVADMRLTERTIKPITPPPKGYSITWDDEFKGLGLRTTANGVKAFVYNFRTGRGQQRRITLGKWPVITATAARIRARDFATKVHLGEDPLEQKQTERAALTTKRLVDLFADGGVSPDGQKIASHLRSKKRGWELELYLRRDFLSFIGPNTKAEDVRRSDIKTLLNEKAMTAPVAANRLLEAVRLLYNWGIDEELIEATPCARLKRPGGETSRDRVLSEDEIGTFWNRLDSTTRMSEDVRVALRLVLLTAARPGEICGMEWTELDLKRRWWEIPRERTKADRVHRVPLTGLALEQIEKQPRVSRWVFPSVRERPLKVLALSHALRHNREHFGLPRFTPHDLRRTCASHLADVDVERFIIARVLNHADREVTGVYDRFGYDKQKRRALERWERKLRAIIGEPVEAKVVEFFR